MAGESIVVRSSYGEVLASESVAGNGGFSAGTVTPVASIAGITGNQKDYILLDFKLKITAETFVDGDRINLYRIPSDGTDESAAPSAGIEVDWVGTFVCEAASTVAYIYGVENVDQNDKWMWKNGSGASVTASLEVRTRSTTQAL